MTGRRIATTTVVVALIATAVSLAGGSSATAVDAAPASARPALGAPTSVSPSAAAIVEYSISAGYTSTTRQYGAGTPDARRIAISPDTAEIVLEPGFDVPQGALLVCSSPAGVIDATQWSAEDWDAVSVHTAAVTPGAVEAGGSYAYSCRVGEEESTTITWSLIGEQGAPSPLTLDTDPAKLVSTSTGVNYVSDEGEPTRVVALGDRIRVVGAPGAWQPTAGEPRPEVLFQSDGAAPDTPADDVAISADGSALEFSVPQDLPTGFLNGYGWVSAVVSSSVDGTDTVAAISSTAVWDAYLQYPVAPRATSTTSLRLDRPIGTSTTTRTAIVTVRSPIVPGDREGEIELSVDGVPVSNAPIDLSRSSTIAIELPKLPRGRHTVSATLLQSGNLTASTSRTAVVRILR